MRAAWEAERADRWNEVISNKGAEFEEANRDYMASKAEAEAVVAELRRRGLIRRGRLAGSSARRTADEQTPAGDFASTFHVEQSARRLAVTADSHLRYGDKDRTALAAALRAGIARLRFEDGEVLRGAFHGAKPTKRTDLENLVFYNLDLPTAAVQRGVSFEHSPQPPAQGTIGYVYEPVPATDATRLWRPGERIISFTNVALPGRSAPAIWWSMKSHGCPERTADGDEDVFVVCRVATAAAVGATQLKALVDGTLAGAQWMPDPPDDRCALVEAALASVLAVKPDIRTISAVLRDDSTAALGPCADLVRWDGGINPDDHRLVAGLVLIEPSPSTSTHVIDASVHIAVPHEST